MPEFIEVTRAGTGNHEVAFQDKHGKEMFKARSDSLSGAIGFSMTIKASDVENSSPRVWLLVGLEEDNWWQTYAPPDVNVICVPEADARGAYQYCKDIIKWSFKDLRNVLFIGAGALNRASWLDVDPRERFYEDRGVVDYPWGEVIDLVFEARKKGATTIVEVPDKPKFRKSAQYKNIVDCMKWERFTIADCCHGRRICVPQGSGAPNIVYVNEATEFLIHGLKAPENVKGVCGMQHHHASREAVETHGDGCGKRTSKVSRLLLKMLSERDTKVGDPKACSSVEKLPSGKDRMIIEFCCSKDSSLGKSSNATRGAHVMRVHEALQAQTKACESNILKEAERFRKSNPKCPILVFASLPCTGGSNWIKVNEMGGETEKGKEHRKKFRDLLKALKRLLRKLAVFSPKIAFELPKTCLYWSWPEVQALIKQHSLRVARIDGCMMGVVDKDGIPLLKAWCIATNVSTMLNLKGVTCDNTHEHGTPRGQALKEAGNYTPHMAKLLHNAWRDEARNIRRGSAQSVHVAASCVLVHVSLRCSKSQVQREFQGTCIIVCPTPGIGFGSSDPNPKCSEGFGSAGSDLHLGKGLGSAGPRTSMDGQQQRPIPPHVPWSRPQDLFSLPYQRSGINIPVGNGMTALRTTCHALRSLRGQPLPGRLEQGMVATNANIAAWVEFGVPAILLAAVAAPSSPYGFPEVRVRELFRGVVESLLPARSAESYKTVLSHVTTFIKVVKTAISTDSTRQVLQELLDHVIEIDLFKNIDMFVDVLVQDADQGRLDPQHPCLTVVTMDGYLDPNVICRPVVTKSAWIYVTRYNDWMRLNSYFRENLPNRREGLPCMLLTQDFWDLLELIWSMAKQVGYCLRSHNQVAENTQMNVWDLIEIVVDPPENVSAAVAHAVNSLQGLSVALHTAHEYLNDSRTVWPSEPSRTTGAELRESLVNATTVVMAPPPTGLGLPASFSHSSWNQLAAEQNVLRAVHDMYRTHRSWMSEITNLRAECYSEGREQPPYLKPDPTGTVFPPALNSHPPWVNVQRQHPAGPASPSVPEGPAPFVEEDHPANRSTSTPSPRQATGASFVEARGESAKRQRGPEDVRSAASQPGTAASSSDPRGAEPTAQPEGEPDEVRWYLDPTPDGYMEKFVKFQSRHRVQLGTTIIVHKDDPTDVLPARDQTPKINGKFGTSSEQIYLRRVTTHLAKLYGMSQSNRAGAFHMATFMKKGDVEWLRLYKVLYEKVFLCTIRQLPTPGTMFAAVMQSTATGELGIFHFNSSPEQRALLTAGLRKFSASIRQASTPDVTAVRSSKTIILADFEVWTKTKNRLTYTMASKLQEKGWYDAHSYCQTVDESLDPLLPEGFQVVATKARDAVREWRGPGQSIDVTAHVYLSFRAINDLLVWEHGNATPENMRKWFVDPIMDLSDLLQRAVIVTLNDDPRFIGKDVGAAMPWAAIDWIAVELRARGCIVFTSSLLWARIAVTLHKGSDNFRINPEEMHLAVAAFDKHLLQEKIITLCMAPPESMGDCEPHLDSVNMETADAKAVFAPSSSDDVRTASANDDTQERHQRVVERASELEGVRGGVDMTWVDADIAMVSPEPFYDGETYWIDIEGLISKHPTAPSGQFHVCQACVDEFNKLKNSFQGEFGPIQSPAYCPFCSLKAMWDKDYGVNKWEEVRKSERHAAGCAIFAQKHDFVYQDGSPVIPKEDLKSYIFACSKVAYTNYGKIVSSSAGLRLNTKQASEYTRWAKGRRLSWDFGYTVDGMACLLPLYDASNAAYAGFLHSIFDQDEVKGMYNGNADPAAELMGDTLEVALGILTIACRYPSAFETWGSYEDHLACLRGIERSFYRFAAAEAVRITAVENRKRRPPRANDAETIQQIMEYENTLLQGEWHAVLVDRVLPIEEPVLGTLSPEDQRPEEFSAAPINSAEPRGGEPEGEDQAHEGEALGSSGVEPEGQEDDDMGVPEASSIPTMQEPNETELGEISRPCEGYVRALNALRITAGMQPPSMCLACGNYGHNTRNCEANGGYNALVVNEAFSIIGKSLAKMHKSSSTPPTEIFQRWAEKNLRDAARAPQVPGTASDTPGGDGESVEPGAAASSEDSRGPLPRRRQASISVEDPTVVVIEVDEEPEETATRTLRPKRRPQPRPDLPEPKAAPAPRRWIANSAGNARSFVEIRYHEPKSCLDIIKSIEDVSWVGGQSIYEIGLQSQDATRRLIEQEVGGDVATHPLRSDIDEYPSSNVGYVNIGKLVIGGDLRLLPIKGARFAHRHFSALVPATSSNDNHRNRDYHRRIKSLGYDVQRLLRHRLANRETNYMHNQLPTIPCDTGGWVMLKDFIHLENFWQSGRYYARSSARDDNSEYQRRIQMLIDYAYYEYRTNGRIRLQFLGIKIVAPKPGQRASDTPWDGTPGVGATQRAQLEELGGHRLTHDITSGTLRRCDNWVQPWAIRATSGHSSNSNSLVRVNDDRVACHLTTSLVNQIGGGYHTTAPELLANIVAKGLLPGGGASGGRVHSHFGTFPPWDPRNQTVRTRIPGRPRSPIAVLYVPAYELMRYNAVITINGMFLVQRQIPFEAVKHVWICMPSQGRYFEFSEVFKVYSKELSKEMVEGYGDARINPDREPPKPSVEDLVSTMEGTDAGPHEGERREILQAIEQAGDTVPGNIIKRAFQFLSRTFRRVTTHTTTSDPLILRVCPCCGRHTPASFAICLTCGRVFLSMGRIQHVRANPEPERIDPEVVRQALNQAAAVVNNEVVEIDVEEEPTAEPVQEDALPLRGVQNPAGDVEANSPRESVAEPEAEEIPDEIRDMYRDVEMEAPNQEEVEMDAQNQRAFVLVGDREGDTLDDRNERKARLALECNVNIDTDYAACVDHNFRLYCHLDAFFAYVLVHKWNLFEKIIMTPYKKMKDQFASGMRHDASGTWPIVPIDEDTALPRDLTEDEVRQYASSVENQQFMIERYYANKFVFYVMRGAIQLGYNKESFNLPMIPDEAEDPKAFAEAGQRVHMFMAKIIYQVLNVRLYSYTKPNAEIPYHAAFKYINPIQLLSLMDSQKVSVNNLLVMRDSGCALPNQYSKKLDRWLSDQKKDMSILKLKPTQYLENPKASALYLAYDPSASAPSVTSSGGSRHPEADETDMPARAKARMSQPKPKTSHPGTPQAAPKDPRGQSRKGSGKKG